jgi:Trk K+ transport system NAD-binding subunit
VIVFAILTVLIMPLLFSILAPDSPQPGQVFHLIMGTGNLGITVAQQLSAHGDQVQFLLVNQAEEDVLAEVGLPSLGMGIEMLGDVQPASIESALVLYDDDLMNLELAKAARTAGIKDVIARVHDPQLLPDFEGEGIKAFSPALERATMVSMMARSPDVLDLLKTSSDERAAEDVIIRNPQTAGKKLRELNLPGDLLILAIRRNQRLLIPRGDTTFEIGDRVSMIGDHDSLRIARKVFLG